MYGFYLETYGGSALSEAEFAEAVKRATEQLALYERSFRVTGDEVARKMAICAMADAIVYFQKAQNGEGGHEIDDDFVCGHDYPFFISMLATTAASTGASIQYRDATVPVANSTRSPGPAPT